MVAESGPYYPGTVLKSFTDADISSITQADVASVSASYVQAEVEALVTAVNKVLGVLGDLGVRETS